MNWVFVGPTQVMVKDVQKFQGTYAMKIFDCLECDFYKSEYYQHGDLNSQLLVNYNCDK